jgi:hypothetical protein
MPILHLDGSDVTPFHYTERVNEAGRKDDTGKLPFELVPPEALELIVAVLGHGARKYTPDNWKRVPDGRRRYFGALMRHAWAYARGEAKDPESGLPHLAHAGACILFLLSDLEGDTKS